jgi:hypothetical protein
MLDLRDRSPLAHGGRRLVVPCARARRLTWSGAVRPPPTQACVVSAPLTWFAGPWRASCSSVPQHLGKRSPRVGPVCLTQSVKRRRPPSPAPVRGRRGFRRTLPLNRTPDPRSRLGRAGAGRAGCSLQCCGRWGQKVVSLCCIHGGRGWTRCAGGRACSVPGLEAPLTRHVRTHGSAARRRPTPVLMRQVWPLVPTLTRRASQRWLGRKMSRYQPFGCRHGMARPAHPAGLAASEDASAPLPARSPQHALGARCWRGACAMCRALR